MPTNTRNDKYPYGQSNLICRCVEFEEVTPLFVLDVKAAARAHRVSYHRWLDYMMDLYSNYRGIIVDAEGNEVFLETVTYFEQNPDSIRYWFRDQLMPCRVPATYIRRESFERYRIWATILKAHDPEGAKRWGKA